MHSAVSGLMGGALATLCMSAIMLGGKKLGIQGELPPKRITEHLVPNRRPANDSTLKIATATAHMAFGMSAGAAFAIALDRARVKPRPLHGMLYGLGVWLLSYQGWVPLLGLMPPASRDRPGRVGTNVLAHLVYGAVLGACAGEERPPVANLEK